MERNISVTAPIGIRSVFTVVPESSVNIVLGYQYDGANWYIICGNLFEFDRLRQRLVGGAPTRAISFQDFETYKKYKELSTEEIMQECERREGATC